MKIMRLMRFISYVCCMRGWGEVVIICYYRVVFVSIGRGEDVIIWYLSLDNDCELILSVLWYFMTYKCKTALAVIILSAVIILFNILIAVMIILWIYFIFILI